MKLKGIFYGLCVLATVGFASCDKDNGEDSNTLNDTDVDYLIKASIGNTAEIDAATLASTKATNPRVKTFAQHMLSEHGLAQTDLKNLSNSVGYPVKDTLDPAHVAIKAQLSALPAGRAFDSAYMHGQVADHNTTITNFQVELTNGRHNAVKDYANKYLPHIQMHLQQADSIANAYFKR